MITCKTASPDVCTKQKTICCAICEDRQTCKDACANSPHGCESAVFEKPKDQETALVAFQQTAAAAIQRMTNCLREKANLDAREKELRAQLEKAMEEYGITKFETADLIIGFIPASNRRTVDSKKLEAKFPDAYAACLRESTVKASVRITLKDGGK